MWVFSLAVGLLLSPAPAVAADAEACFARSGSFRIDIDVCSRALRREGLSELTRATLHLRRGEAYLKGQAIALAMQDIDQAMLLNPGSSRAYELRGDVFRNMGKYILASDSYANALKLNPYFASSYKSRGLSALMMARFTAAIDDLSQALSLSPQDPETIALRAIARFAQGDSDAAIVDMKSALSRAYPYPLGHLWIHFAARQTGKAPASFTRRALRETDPDIWPGQLIRAIVSNGSEATARSAAEGGPPPRQMRRTLQADFYLGAEALLDGNRDKAARLLTRVAGTQTVVDAVEVPVARQLLKTLSD